METPLTVIPSAGVFVFYWLTLTCQLIGLCLPIVLIWQIARLSLALSHVAGITADVKLNQSILLQMQGKKE